MDDDVRSVGNCVPCLVIKSKVRLREVANDCAQPVCPRILPDAAPAKGTLQSLVGSLDVFGSAHIIISKFLRSSRSLTM